MQGMLRRIRRHGLAHTAHQLAMKALNLFLEFRVLKGVWVEHPDPAFLDCPERYRAAFLAPAALRELAADPASEISQAFLREALPRGDQCYGICDGTTLASYGWYASGRTPIARELELVFSPEYVYMYKGFTDARYRGQRLHAIGMTRALEHYSARGCRGIVSWVESTNYDSLRSCFRMGYQVFGSVLLLKLLGRWYTFSTPGCRRFAFRVEWTGARRAAEMKLGAS